MYGLKYRKVERMLNLTRQTECDDRARILTEFSMLLLKKAYLGIESQYQIPN